MLIAKTGEMEAQLSAQTDVKGRGAAPGAGTLQEKFRSSYPSVRDGDWEPAKPQRGSKVRPEGAAWHEDTEGRGDPGRYLLHVTVLSYFQDLRI